MRAFAGSIARSSARGFLFLVLGAASLLAMTGCADLVTYANRSRAEGKRLYDEKSYTDAAGAFRNAIRQDPRDYESHFYLGVCYDELGRHQQAFPQYQTSLDIMARYMEGQYDFEFRQMMLETMAKSIAKNDSNDAELNSLEARAKQSNSAEDWFLVAKVYRLRGDADRAMDAYRRAAKWDTESFVIRKEFGLYLLEPLNQRKDAEYFLRQAYRINSWDSSVNGALEKLGVVPLPEARVPKMEIVPVQNSKAVPVVRRVSAPND